MTPAHWIDWLCRDALPLWRGAGFDARRGSFVERLSLDAAPEPDVPRRLMVQARQIHAYATAARRGWDRDGAALALRAADTMVAQYAAGDDGWVFSCDAEGRVVDARRDLYAHAFVLLALASLIRLDGQARHIRLAQGTLAFLDRAMAHPAGGYAEAWPTPALPRRQNPHMHLLEALLALHDTGRCGDMTPRIAALTDLFDRRFLSARGLLCEYFAPDWTPLNPDASFEPGHHYEWLWLLSCCPGLAPRPSTARTDLMLAQALRGTDAQGAVWASVDRNGPARDRRLWAAMEAAKAMTLPQGRAARPAGLAATLTSAWQGFIAPATPGGWIDRIDADGTGLVDHMPASSLYHIVTALDFIAGA